jgi:hypothetical protein
LSTPELVHDPDAALELGDVQLDVREKTGIIQVVAGFRMPLTCPDRCRSRAAGS